MPLTIKDDATAELVAELARTVGVTKSEAEHALAVEAFARFGKGRHPARLNMGDCYAYSCVRAYGARLLDKGEDFALTDRA
ncbi:type II toxin-antitoxin system VapC family toxin [Methylobacterium durans]|uniref:type II toxin-antitoxin system VapB family antitoxin n=1 Tax=Methylobacterium durans TaxID=2202825 RepID=UPI0018800696